MVSLHLLGPLQVENDGKIVTSFRSNRAVALLAYLVCRQRPVSRDELVELIWPDRPEAKGQANLRWALNYLGTLLPGCWENNRQTICFLAERAVVDLNRLRLSYEQAAWSDLTAVLANIHKGWIWPRA